MRIVVLGLLLIAASVSLVSAAACGCGCPEPDCLDCPTCPEQDCPEPDCPDCPTCPEQDCPDCPEPNCPEPEIIEKIVNVPGPDRIVEVSGDCPPCSGGCENITIRINEAGKDRHELFALDSCNRSTSIPIWINISGWKILDSSGRVVVNYPDRTFIQIGNYSVFSSDCPPEEGPLTLVRETGEVVDIFNTYREDETRTSQRIPDLADWILRKMETFGRSNN